MTLTLRNGARDVGSHILTKTGKRVEHGTVNAYDNLGCRCALCTDAWRVHYTERSHRLGYSRPWDEYVQERRAAVRHGTRYMANGLGCSCDECRAWKRENRRRYRVGAKPVRCECGALCANAHGLRTHRGIMHRRSA